MATNDNLNSKKTTAMVFCTWIKHILLFKVS